MRKRAGRRRKMSKEEERMREMAYEIVKGKGRGTGRNIRKIRATGTTKGR